jgi:ABC-type uncharacterized transport system auxiliary subunit
MMPPQRTKQISALLLSFLVGLVGGGCLSKPALKQETFAFQTPPPAKNLSPTGGVVTVRSVTVSPLFIKHSFVYRTGPQAYETDSYASFMVAPSQAIAIAVRAHLLSSGRFQDVVDSGSRVRADKAVDLHVSELYGDFSQSGQPVAVLSMRITFFDGNATKSREPLLQKDYARRVPLREKTAAAVMAGWDTALGEIITEAATDQAGGKRL